ncbi:MAG: hypothetical protein MUO50_18725 [Longimicrobiales bacterium]|nr:hypothetical protein [Longimicrobiales bacterium]
MAPTADKPKPPTIAQLTKQAREATQALARRPDVEAFHALLGLSQLVGESLGESARLLAANSSWSQVAEVSGTTKQAAWSRWNG